MRKWQKNKFWAWFWPVLTQIFSPKPFCESFFLIDVIHCCKESLYSILMKTNVSNMKNDKYPSFGPDFGLFGPNFGPKNFFHGFYINWMLWIIASCHCIELQGKLMNQSWENSQKPSFGPNFGTFWPKFPPPPKKYLCGFYFY